MAAERCTALERRALSVVLREGRTSDDAAARLAELQLGLITRRQANAVGLTRDMISTRLTRCRWRLVHRGVYELGPHDLIDWSREMAAVLACGPGTLLAGHSAAAAAGLRDRRPERPQVLVVGHHLRTREGIELCRTAAIDPRDWRWFRGIPTLAPARALIEVAAELRPRALEQAVATGYRRNIVRRAEIEAALERAPRRRGAAAMRALLASEGEPAFTRSQLEELGLGLIRRAGLPAPEVNHPRGPRAEVDFVWPEHRYILELDGHPFHSLEPDRERDYERDDDHQHAGFHVTRASGRQARDEPERLLVRIVRGLYGASPAAGRPR
jgi:hypothetical protein